MQGTILLDTRDHTNIIIILNHGFVMVQHKWLGTNVNESVLLDGNGKIQCNAPVSPLSRELTWSIFSELIWLILDLDAQYFDIHVIHVAGNAFKVI